MINHELPANNFPRYFLLLGLLFALAWLPIMAGCNKDGNNQSQSPSKEKETDSENCGISVDTSAWLAFAEISRRATDPEPAGLEAYQEYSDLPIIAKWCEGFGNDFPTSYLVNWLDFTFDKDFKYNRKKKYNSYQVDYSMSYKYTIEHLDEVEPRLSSFVNDGYLCRLAEKTNFWLYPQALSDSFTVVFLPTKPEIRTFENYSFVDTGVLVAGRNEQLVDHLAANIFRNRVMLFSDNPLRMEGRQALAHLFRASMREGVPSYIGNKLETMFARNHRTLGKVNMVPERFFGSGRKTIEMINNNLPKMLEDEQLLNQKGRDFVKALITSGAISFTGYCMSTTIVDRFSEEKLRDTIGLPAAWLKAYQEAALMNPSPTPQPGEVINEWSKSMPPFEDVAYQGLLEILEETFPAP